MYFLLLLIIAIPSFVSLINPWYFAMHDDSHVVRLFLLDKAIHQGYLLPRWVDVFGFGFGYPLFNFYPPLIYYISEIFRLTGFSYIWSVKAMVILGYIVGAVGMYLLSHKVYPERSRRIASLVAATLFTFFTYHAVLVYVRGAFAEFFGMNILPYAFLGLEMLREKQTIKRTVFFGIALSLLILSHLFVALPFVLFFAIYVLYSILIIKDKTRYILYTALGGLLGAGLSAFFWLPAIVERSFTLVKSLSISELFKFDLHFIYPSQFLYSPWGYGGSVQGPIDGLSFQLGKIHVALAALSLVLFVFLSIKKKIETLHATRYMLYALLLSFSLFMATEYSKFVWDAFAPLQYLQFPWRFLTFVGVFISVLGGYFVAFVSYLFESIGQTKRGRWVGLVVSILVICVVIFQYQKYFRPSSYVSKTDTELTSFKQIAWTTSSSTFDFIPQGVPIKKSLYGSSVVDIDESQVSSIKYQVSSKGATVAETKADFSDKQYNVKSKQPFVFQLNTFNFPGWVVYIDGKRTMISDRNKYKLITVQVPSGEHTVRFAFEDTPIRKWSNLLSLTSLVGASSLLIVGKFKKREA